MNSKNILKELYIFLKEYKKNVKFLNHRIFNEFSNKFHNKFHILSKQNYSVSLYQRFKRTIVLMARALSKTNALSAEARFDRAIDKRMVEHDDKLVSIGR